MPTASGLTWRAPAPLREHPDLSDIHPIIRQTLSTRGIDPGRWREELSPQDRYDLSSLVDLSKAAERVARAIRAHEMIGIIGDYDVDGACSSALVADVLSLYDANFAIHIPDRILEGYGPSTWAIEEFAAKGAKVLLTLDCGSAANIPLNHAIKLGIDVIVLDHHQIADIPPPVFALVNPSRTDDSSGLQRLSAAGITRLFLLALDQLLDRRLPPSYGADLATLALVADVMPFSPANRALARTGLKQMQSPSTLRPGFKALFRQIKMRGAPSAEDLGWKIGPRINAGGRIGDPSLGWRLLATSDTNEADAIAEKLDLLNDDRRLIEKSAVAAAIKAFDANVDPDSPIIVMHDPALPPGIAGLIAARLKQRYQRPAIALAGVDPVGGSARSIPGVDIGALIHAAVAMGIASKGGGHAMAAGLTLPAANIASLKFFLEAEMAALPTTTIDTSFAIDANASPSDFTRQTFDQVEQLGPYANTHLAPTLRLARCAIENLSAFGQGHMRCEIVSGAGRCRGFAFNAESTALLALTREAVQGAPVDIAGVMEASDWTPRGLSEFKISDIRKSD